jgi:hypothetical protein
MPRIPSRQVSLPSTYPILKHSSGIHPIPEELNRGRKDPDSYLERYPQSKISQRLVEQQGDCKSKKGEWQELLQFDSFFDSLHTNRSHTNLEFLQI